jgi:antitoxin VapB
MVKKGRKATSLNVKDPEAHRPAQAIAQETGETMTRDSVEELRAIAKRAAGRVKRPYLDHAELLYDKHGLPK